MNEFYIVDGQTYEVAPNRKQEFLSKFPNAILKQEAKTTGVEMGATAPPSQAPTTELVSEPGLLESQKTETQEEDTWLEDTFGKNFLTDYVGDLYRGFKSGYRQSTSIDEAFDIMSKGSSSSYEDIEKFIKASEYSQQAPMSDEMKKFQEIYEQEGGGAFGFLKGMVKTRFQVVPQVMASSIATMIGSALNADEVAKAGLAGATGGAALGLAGGVFAPITSTAAGISGLVTGVTGAMESGLTFSELIQEELSKQGKDFTKENVKELLSNEEKFRSLKNKSIGRGATIGVIEGLGTALTGGAIKALKPTTALGRVGRTAAAFGLEGTVGGLGEAAGRAVAGQEMDAAEIGLEAVGGMTGAPLAFVKAATAKQEYKINGETVTRQQVEEFINSDDGKNIATSKIQIKNDDELLKKGLEKINKARAKEASSVFIKDEKDLETFVDLELERKNLDTSSFIGKERAKEIDVQLKDIYNKYSISEKEINVEKGKLGAKSIIREEIGNVRAIGGNIRVLNKEDILNEFSEKEAEANAFVNNKTNEIIINADNAEKTFYATSASHEMLHNIIRSSFSVRKDENGQAITADVERVEKIIDSLKQKLDKNIIDQIQDRIDTQYRYNEDGSEKQLYEYAEEYVTSLSDIINNPTSRVSLSTSTIEKIQNFFKEILAAFGLTDVRFKNGDDVVSFVKDYRKNLAEGKISKRAKAMMDLDNSNDIRAEKVSFSKSQQQLNDRVDNLVGQKNQEGKYNWKSKEEFQSSQEFVNTYDTIINGTIIDPLIRRGIEGDAVYGLPIEDFVAQVKDELTGVLMRFDPTKNNSLIGFINTQLGYRKQDIIKKRAQEGRSESIDIEEGEIGSVSRDEYSVEADFDERIDTFDEEVNQESSLIDPTTFLGVDGEQEARDIVLEAMSALDEEKISSFKNVPGLLTEQFAYAAGVPVSKISDPKKNLSSSEALSAQQYLLGIADQIIKVLPQGAVTGAATQNLIGTSTGVRRNLLKEFYEKDTTRRTEAQGLFEFKLRDNITREDVLDFIGLQPDGTQEKGFSPRSPKGQNIKALLAQLDQLATNTTYRKILQDNGANANKIQDIASGKSIYQYSEGQKLTSKSQIDDFFLRINKIQDLIYLGYDPQSGSIQKIVNSAKTNNVRNILNNVLDSEDTDFKIASLVSAGQRGYAYEKLVLENLKRFEKQIEGLKITQKTIQKDNRKVDLTVFYKGENFNIELKLNSLAQIGSIGTSSYVDGITQNIEQTSFEGQLNQKARESKAFADFIEKYKEFIVDGKIELTEEQIEAEKELNAFAEIRNSLTIETDESPIKDVYITSKNTNYINFGDAGTFALDENNNPLGLPVLKANVKIVTRLVPGSTKANGKRTMYLRSFPLLEETWAKENKSSANFNDKNGIENHFVNYSMPTEETIQQMEDRMAAILSNMDKRYTAGQTLDRATAKNLAATRSKRRDILAPSADDFVGLLYRFLDKGKLGEEQYKFFEDNLIKPFSKAYYALNATRQQISKSYKSINRANPEVVKKLKKDSGFAGFTFEQALRVWLFNKIGVTPNGLNEETKDALLKIVKNNPDIQSYGEQLSAILPMTEYWVDPDARNWQVDTIKSDMVTAVEKVSRKAQLEQWIQNKKAIFSDNNMNKIEATYGPDFRAALEDMLYRMENGTARPEGTNKQMNQFLNWIRGSVAVTMFFNTRSAILQQVSLVNFINWGDNNPIKAAMALANVDQYAKDWAFIFNSDYLKERRGGLKTDVNAADLADAIKKGGVKGLHAKLLQLGFSLTQIGDSVAIATGGATFLRNRTNTYISQGLSLQEAEQKAFLDFQEISEESQQSARPDRLAKQQTDVVGRVFLAFQNTPMQYTRIIVKAAKDLAAGRGDRKTNISKIVHYMVVQNIVFSAMQQALFSMLFDDEEDEKEAEANQKKVERIINNYVDTVLRGTGMYGAILATAKNTILKFAEQEARQEEGRGRADHAYTMIEAFNISPAIGIKSRELYGSIQNYRYNKDIIDDMGVSINNPALDIAGSASAFALNIPLDRAISKVRNLKAASDAETETWAKIALALGWNTWNVGIENKELEEVKTQAKKQRKTTTKKREAFVPKTKKSF